MISFLGFFFEILISGSDLSDAFRNTLGIFFHTILPDASTLCKFRKMRLDENTMDEIMTEIVRQMLEKGIIKSDSGIVIDSTHINANPLLFQVVSDGSQAPLFFCSSSVDIMIR